MPIRITGLRAQYTKPIDTVARAAREGFVLSVDKDVVILAGTVDSAIETLQGILNEIREEKGATSGHYRALVTVRNILDSEKEDAKRGKSKVVSIIPNGANIAKDVPPMLDGIPILTEAEVPAPGRRGPGRPRKVAEAKPAAKAASRASASMSTPGPMDGDNVPDGKPVTERVVIDPPASQPAVNAGVLANWEAMRKSAPNEKAAKFWGRKIEELANL